MLGIKPVLKFLAPYLEAIIMRARRTYLTATNLCQRVCSAKSQAYIIVIQGKNWPRPVIPRLYPLAHTQLFLERPIVSHFPRLKMERETSKLSYKCRTANETAILGQFCECIDCLEARTWNCLSGTEDDVLLSLPQLWQVSFDPFR